MQKEDETLVNLTAYIRKELQKKLPKNQALSLIETKTRKGVEISEFFRIRTHSYTPI